MRNLSKLISFVIIITILISSMCSVSYASNAGDFVVQNGILTAYKGSDVDVVIPDNLGIVTIGDKAFHGQAIHSIVIPQGVSLIGGDAFNYCESLTTVSIPNSVTLIGDEAFADCHKLTTVNIPDSVKTIGNSAFYFCKSLMTLSIPDSVTSIGREAFVYTPLTAINLPKNITSIELGTFIGCSRLTSVTIPDGVTSIGDEAFADCTSLKTVHIPDSVTSVGFATFENTALFEPLLLNNSSYLCYVPNSFTDYTIPETVIKISGGAFYGCSDLKTIIIPPKVSEIGKFTFYECASLSSVTIPDSVTSIGDYAFYECRNLTSITIPQNVTDIGENVFSLTGLKTPIYSDSGRKLCFVPANTTSYDIPSTVKKISGGAFAGCSQITTLSIPEGVTSIGTKAFSGCSNLATVTIPESVNEIGAFAFNDCISLTSVNIPQGFTQIPNGLFSGCSSLKAVRLPSTITSIGECAFYSCKSLTSINIPDKTTYIGSIAFSNTYLTSIYLSNRSIVINGMAFPTKITIYGHSSSTAETYAEAFKCSFVLIDKTAQPSSSTVLVNGKSVTFQAYTIDDNNYFKLRDLATALNGTGKQFGVGWDGINNAIAITSNTPYTPVGGELNISEKTSNSSATLSSAQIYVDGKIASLTAYTIDGNNYFKLRDIGQTLNFGVTWAGSTNTINIDTSRNYPN